MPPRPRGERHHGLGQHRGFQRGVPLAFLEFSCDGVVLSERILLALSCQGRGVVLRGGSARRKGELCRRLHLLSPRGSSCSRGACGPALAVRAGCPRTLNFHGYGQGDCILFGPVVFTKLVMQRVKGVSNMPVAILHAVNVYSVISCGSSRCRKGIM
jgi:hypothetical protein